MCIYIYTWRIGFLQWVESYKEENKIHANLSVVRFYLLHYLKIDKHETKYKLFISIYKSGIELTDKLDI